jgi:GNAT superfamily N-acetyltransferase
MQAWPESSFMPLVYFRRFKMLIDLEPILQRRPQVPDGFTLVPWDVSLTRQHALAKWNSFRNELDANVFPCLGNRDGCRRLIQDITQRNSFVAESTWLLVDQRLAGRPTPVGTIQGLRSDPHLGAIQNLGVVPEYRGQGLGQALLLQSLQGFHAVGCRRVSLEVTTHNTAAVALYQRFGFRIQATVYKLGAPDS